MLYHPNTLQTYNDCPPPLTRQKPTRNKDRPKRKTPSIPTSLPLPTPPVRQRQSRQKHPPSSKGGHDSCPALCPNTKDPLHLTHCCGLPTVGYHRVGWRSDCSPSPHIENEVFRGTLRGSSTTFSGGPNQLRLIDGLCQEVMRPPRFDVPYNARFLCTTAMIRNMAQVYS